MDLDLFLRLALGASLLIALVVWLLAFLGRYNAKKQPTPEQPAMADKLQPFVIGLLGLATLGEVLIDDPGNTGVLLAVFALLGWTQDRLRVVRR